MKRDNIPAQEQEDMDNILTTLKWMSESRRHTEKQLEEIETTFILPGEVAEPEHEPEDSQPDEGVDFIIPSAVEPEDEDVQTVSLADFVLAAPAEEEPVEETTADGKPVRRNPFRVLWEAFRVNLPNKQDSAGARVRKITFLAALAVLLGALIYILVDVCIIPLFNARLNEELREMYEPENSQVVEEGDYPEGMLASFRALYDINPDVRGWISYHAGGKEDFLHIEYPVMYSGDHEKYLRTDFFLNKNKNGTLFFDKDNKLETAEDENKAVVIYGHNMASGQMFAGLNELIGSVNNARTTSELTFSTLFEKSEYRVFAVIITDEDETDRWYFNTRRTQFAGEVDFLNYVKELRARSLFDYPVDISAEDELLVLSTCTAKSTSKLENGRLTVIARKVRPDEGFADTSLITKNEDVIMPRRWYENQDLPLHEYYSKGVLDLIPLGTTTTTTTGVTGSTTSATETTADTTGTTTTTTTAASTTTTTTAPTTTTTAAPMTTTAAEPSETTTEEAGGSTTEAEATTSTEENSDPSAAE